MGNNTFRYGIIGGGRQGTAAAYDLALRGDAEVVYIADQDLKASRIAAARVNQLCKKEIAVGREINVHEPEALPSFLKGLHAIVSAVPYYLNLSIAECAVKARVSMTDLGGHTEQVFQELQLNDAAQEAKITVVPDCGMVPGLGTSLCVYAMELVEKPSEVFLWDGGLPVHPRQPWNYILTFHFEGLINEYYGTTEFIRDHKIVNVPCFEEYELVDFPDPIGRLEAFTTAGGTSTAPRTFLGKLKTYQNKTLRYPGHCQQWKTMRDAGLFETDPVSVQGKMIRPRDLLKEILDPQLRPLPDEDDVCILRSQCNGGGSSVVVDLFDHRDSQTGFTAMERTTGFHAAMIASMIAHGEVAPGAVPVELAVPGHRIVEECKKRGMKVDQRRL
jgi:lysine 6-dehydrogenase